MARTSYAVLAALLAAAPVAALAQTATAPAAAPESAAAPAGSASPAASPDAPAVVPAAPADAAAPAAAGSAAQTPAPAASPDPAPAAPAATPAPAAPAATPAPAANPAPAADGAPAPAGNAADDQQVGSYYSKSTHDEWTLRCLRTKDGKDPCELYQLLKDQYSKPVAEISVIPFTGKAAAILNFVAPLETDLQAGLGLKIDAAAEHRYPFLVCAPVGCVSRIGMTDAELNGLKKGSVSTVSLLPFGGDPAKDQVKLNMSLKGFTAGFTALQDAAKAAQK
ncbi:invasion associated locus B family protein [Paracoccus contaminans]|uniref:Invasion protein n=1 Tax=Paracoccus contaminans TaxID=1945662 RepID=A0A1W6D012_9RHOB|nr:invasion associated locus B family protein [Paracoccus contaminans]ARJ70474.1 hypothetical protein B0A89_13335 [Paracoccus contaminans]